jgi:hypothetical protein
MSGTESKDNQQLKSLEEQIIIRQCMDSFWPSEQPINTSRFPYANDTTVLYQQCMYCKDPHAYPLMILKAEYKNQSNEFLILCHPHIKSVNQNPDHYQLADDNIQRMAVTPVKLHCPNALCKQIISRAEIRSHVSECLFELIDCKLCWQRICRSEASHQCPVQLNLCPCGNYYAPEMLKNHNQNCTFVKQLSFILNPPHSINNSAAVRGASALQQWLINEWIKRNNNTSLYTVANTVVKKQKIDSKVHTTTTPMIVGLGPGAIQPRGTNNNNNTVISNKQATIKPNVVYSNTLTIVNPYAIPAAIGSSIVPIRKITSPDTTMNNDYIKKTLIETSSPITNQ